MAEKIGVVAFAFGVPSTIRSNQFIASTALEEARACGAPIYTQKDIQINDPQINIERIAEASGSPSPTLRIARGAVRWAHNLGLETLIVVAAEPHMSRCFRDLEYAVREAMRGRLGKKDKAYIYVTTPRHATYHHEFHEWFCPNSEQARTRSREDWEKGERIIRSMPMWLYKLVAS